MTGGLGFLGSAVVGDLLRRQHEVTVFDNSSRGTIDNVDAQAVEVFAGDVCDLAALRRCVSAHQYTAIVHLAATHFIPDCNRDPQSCITTNVVGTENLLTACDEQSIDRVIAASSMAVYPISDDACSEDEPVGPYDVYGETKVANEMQLRRWSRRNNRRIAVALRLSNAYGPRETNAHVIPEIMRQLTSGATNLDLGATEPLRDYIHVDDVAAAVSELIQAPLDPGYHVFNVGCGEERSVASILEGLGDILGRPVTAQIDASRLRPVERMHLLADIGRITTMVGWKPKVVFERGLTDLCRWYGLIGQDQDLP